VLRDFTAHSAITANKNFLPVCSAQQPLTPQVNNAHPPAPTFHFRLEGNDVRGDRASCGAEFDFIFDYRTPPADIAAHITGTILEGARLASAELGVTVTPKGFQLADGVWFRTVCFESEKLIAPVKFRMRAAVQAVEDSGVSMSPSTTGAERFMKSSCPCNSSPEKPT
jgi:hypothetical protein